MNVISSSCRGFVLFLIVFSATAQTPPDLRGVDYALILDAPALAQNTGARAQISSQQLNLRNTLAQRSISITGSASTLVNALFVHVPNSRAAELQSVPGVRYAVYLPPVRRHLNRALDLVNASAAWSQIGGQGNAGTGVKIAVIDSGIDQTHPAMQDSSLQPPAGYPLGDRNFTNNKVIVARSYVSMLPSSGVDAQHSLPDDTTPSDHFGHGTAIAMIAAGAPVQAPVAAISGIAPKAFLGNYKIYGSPGINDLSSAAAIIQALEAALNDGMDIAILASGTRALFGPFDQVGQCVASVSKPYIPGAACDVLTFAVQNAVQSGMTVVVSAGEDGGSGYNFPTLATINSPGTAPDAITVGATTSSHVLYSTVSLAGTGVPANLTNIDARFGLTIKPGGPFNAPLVDVTTLGNNGFACDKLPANSLNGSIALVQRGGDCSFDFKSNNAQTAGAVGMLLYLADGDDDVFTPTNLEDAAMPVVLIGNTSGKAIKAYLATHPGNPVSLDPAWHEKGSTADVVADYSSRGPSIGTYSDTPVRAVKPELVAPGGNIYTAAQRLDPTGDLYDASGYTTVEGNSFSAALVAGAVALVKQAHPGYTPAQLKSAVVNTASTSLRDEAGTARVNAAGAGRLNAQAAVTAQVAVDPPTIAFGAIGATLPSVSLRITNAGSAAVTLNIAVAQRDADSRASVTAPGSVTVAAGQTSSITIGMTGNRPNPGSYEGQINLTAPGVTLHVPYIYMVGDTALSTANIFPVVGDQYVSVPGVTGHLVAARLTDRYGVPIVGRAVNWFVEEGGGRISQGGNGIPNADVQTDRYGTVAAAVDFGNQFGDQIYTADLNGISWEFDLFAAAFPVIAVNGVVNAASFQNTPVAPGSYVTINGTDLAHVTAGYVTTYLPLAIAATSVSFDVPSAGISVPGHLSYVSPTQVNVQVPWELQGQASAQMKVISANIASLLYTLPLAGYGPAAFEYTGSDGQMYAAALDAGSQLITTSNPARAGQYISIYMNGLGPVTNRPASGALSPGTPPLAEAVTPSAITATIGGQPATVAFAGLAPNYVALYQLNLVVPIVLTPGVYPLVITGNGVASKTSLLAVSP